MTDNERADLVSTWERYSRDQKATGFVFGVLATVAFAVGGYFATLALAASGRSDWPEFGATLLISVCALALSRRLALGCLKK
ncbi:MAG: hypothetical protein AB7P99_21285 [Vicinamibacterales bacterium]